MSCSLAPAELKVMSVIWRAGGELPAKDVYAALADDYTRGATYALIHRCIEKRAIERVEPDFVCRSLVAQEDVQRSETRRLIDQVFDGSSSKLLASLVSNEKLSAADLEDIQNLIDGSSRAEHPPL